MAQETSTTFANKTVLVTGAGGGLGRAIAEHFLSSGANVVICDINTKLVDDFKDKLSSAHPKRILALTSDITSDAALDDLFAQATSTFGHFDIVVNSAGVMDRFDPAGELRRSEWDRVIAVNLTAPTMITQRAVKMFLAHGTKGTIVNIASIAGYRGFANGVAYTASKHGLIGLTKNTASFYARKGIRCNAIACGGMPTNIANHLIETNGFNMEGMEVMSRRCKCEMRRSVKHIGSYGMKCKR